MICRMDERGDPGKFRLACLWLCAAAVVMTFSGACSSRLSPARLASVFRPTPRQAAPATRPAPRAVRAPSAVDRAIRMQTQGAFDPLRDDARMGALRGAVEAEPENLTARLQLAQRYEGYGLVSEAMDVYLALLRFARNNESGAELLAAVRMGLARNALSARRAAEAVEVLAAEGAIFADARLSLQLGLLYDQLGEEAKAESAYRAAVRLDSQSSAAHNNLGYRLMRRGELAEAEQHFRAAVAGPAGGGAARNNLGMLLTQRGQYDAAWEQFLSGGSDAATARNNFAVALMSAGRWIESREQLLLALRERRGFAPALRNFQIVQQRIRTASPGGEAETRRAN